MSIPSVLLPVFVLVALAVVLVLSTSAVRIPLLRSGAVHPRDIALGQPAWPDRATQLSNSFNNQFQLPVLFHVLVAFALITHKADLLFVVLSWVFVASRLVHAAIHVTGNRLALRGAAFGAGGAVLILMWVVFAVEILSAPVLT